MSPPGTLEDLSPAELKALVIRLRGDITELRKHAVRAAGWVTLAALPVVRGRRLAPGR
jgi:hypothetical protein